MIKKIKLWYYRNFRILSVDKAIELDLIWVSNLYGDIINKLNCRSIWKDKNGNTYRIDKLK